jgi:hypothetical protein
MSKNLAPRRRPEPVVIPGGFKITKCPPGVADAKPPLSKRGRDKAARKAVRVAHRAGVVPTVTWPVKTKLLKQEKQERKGISVFYSERTTQ